MLQDGKKERIKNAYDYLYNKGLVHSVTDLANKMGRARPGVSNALNGVPEYLNDKFIIRFAKVFGLSAGWLLTGDGEMLLEQQSNEQPVSQEPIDHSSLINALLASKDETIAAQQREIEAKDELIASLKSNLNDLRASLLNGNLKDYPFDMGVAENPVNNSKRV